MVEIFHVYRKEVVQKCFIDQDVLHNHNTFAFKANFYGKTKECAIMCLPRSMHGLLKENECIKVFTMTSFDQFFQMPPCEVDAKRCHKLLTMLQEDGMCMLSDF